MNRFQHTFSKCKKSHYDVPAGKCNNFDKSLVTGQRPPLRYKIQIGLKIILKKYFLATAFSQHIYQIFLQYWIVEFIFYKKATEIWRNLPVLWKTYQLEKIRDWKFVQPCGEQVNKELGKTGDYIMQIKLLKFYETVHDWTFFSWWKLVTTQLNQTPKAQWVRECSFKSVAMPA